MGIPLRRPKWWPPTMQPPWNPPNHAPASPQEQRHGVPPPQTTHGHPDGHPHSSTSPYGQPHGASSPWATCGHPYGCPPTTRPLPPAPLHHAPPIPPTTPWWPPNHTSPADAPTPRRPLTGSLDDHPQVPGAGALGEHLEVGRLLHPHALGLQPAPGGPARRWGARCRQGPSSAPSTESTHGC